MFLRIAPVRSIVVLFLVYALSPLTSVLPVRQEAPRAPLVRLLLIDIVADLTAQPEDDIPVGETEQPLEVLLKKQRAVLRKPPLNPAPPLVMPALSAGQFFPVPSLFARSSLQAPVRVPLTGARISYVGLSPPA